MTKPHHIGLARQLRRNQTEAERLLWSRLRALHLDGLKFRRQHPIGKYVVDFVALEEKLVIELDGGQHNESPIREYDEQRSSWLNEESYRVIRFWDNEVLLNIEGVLEVIMGHVHPLSYLPPQGGEDRKL